MLPACGTVWPSILDRRGGSKSIYAPATLFQNLCGNFLELRFGVLIAKIVLATHD